MYQAPIRAGGAGAHYRQIDINSKIEGASPHRLVSVLYEELVLALANMKLAIRRAEPARQHEAQARAVSIVQALDGSLDHDKGGDIAAALTSVYTEVTRLIVAGGKARDADQIDRAQKLIAEIAEAWNQIG